MTPALNERRAARDELLNQARYYERERRGLGLDYLDAVDRAIDAIAAFPNAWRLYPGLEPVVRVKPVAGFPVGIVYLIDGAQIVILAYAHHQREPFYWVDRIDVSAGGS